MSNNIETQYNFIMEKFNTINDSLTLFKMEISTLQKVVKNVEKDVTKELNNIKKNKKKEKTKTKRAPSGFAKPTKVTKELCEFMNKTEGTEIARTDVTRALIVYIKEKKLEYKENSKIIIPDDKLRDLLGIEENKELTYFSIQKYMNKHFVSAKLPCE